MSFDFISTTSTAILGYAENLRRKQVNGARPRLTLRNLDSGTAPDFVWRPYIFVVVIGWDPLQFCPTRFGT